MPRLPTCDEVKRRTTPATVLLCIIAGYACWGAYGVYCEYDRMREAEPFVARARMRYSDQSTTLDAASELRLAEPGLTDVQRDFATDRFREGDPVERLLTARPPTLVIRHPPYITAYYQNSLGEHDPASEVEVIAKDGKLVRAKTHVATGPRSFREVHFFDDGLLFSKEYMDSLTAGLLRWRAEVDTAVMAVTGTAAASR